MCVALASACGEGVQPDQREMVYFTAIETDTLEAQPIEDPGVNLTPAQVTSSEKIVNGFILNHERLLPDVEIERRIESIENVFFALGRFHELMSIYRDDWEKRGTESHVADRYAWGLVRMGQRKKSREVVNKLLAARPNEGRIHFIDGAIYLQEQPPKSEDFPKIVKAWKRVLEVEPNYRGYEGINAQMLQVEIDKFEARIVPQTEKTALEQAAEIAKAAAQEPAEPTEPTEPAEPAEPVEPAEPIEKPEPAEVVEVNAELDEPIEAPSNPQPPQHNNEQQYRLQIARGQIALGQSDYRAAEEAFILAKGLKPGDFAAEFGHLAAGWGTMSARNDVAAGMRKLAERPDLKPAQRVELGVFLWSKLGRNDLAKAQWEAAKKADPSLAPQVDKLLGQLK